MKIFKFLLLLAFSRPVNADLIAKSSITICENTGGGDDPMSVVYEKACEKKLIVTMSVRSGQVSNVFSTVFVSFLWYSKDHSNLTFSSQTRSLKNLFSKYSVKVLYYKIVSYFTSKMFFFFLSFIILSAWTVKPAILERT